MIYHRDTEIIFSMISVSLWFKKEKRPSSDDRFNLSMELRGLEPLASRVRF